MDNILISSQIKLAGEDLKEYIKSKIKSGELKAGMALPSTRVLSKKFTISVNTAQKVLKELSKENYIIRKHGKQTIVADQQKTMLNATAGALFFGMGTNPFHAMVAAAVSDYGLQNGIRIIAGGGEYHQSIDHTKSFLNKLKENGITHCVLSLQSITERKEIWDYIKGSGIKTVFINDFWNSGGPFSCVRTNEEYGCQLVFDHLFQLGHKKILFLDEQLKELRNYALNAFKQALRENSLKFDDGMLRFIVNPSDHMIWDISDELVQYIIDNFTAVFCTHDKYALRLMRRLHDAGIKIGKDISIVGFDNISQAESADLTTVAQPVKKLVKNAFELLFSNNDENKCICLPPKLIVRGSTGPCPEQKRRNVI